MLLAYGMDAPELMYGITGGFGAGWANTNLTTSREGKILGVASLIPGHETGYLLLALFCLWSGLSMALGNAYGLQKRPSDRLDGYSIFRHGADMSEQLKQDDGFLSGQSFYDNERLRDFLGANRTAHRSIVTVSVHYSHGTVQEDYAD